MAKMRKTITAGPLVMEAVYPIPHPREAGAARQGKKALSSAAQQKMNLKYAYQRLELLIAANFGPRDLWVTLTYDDGHLPASREGAKKAVGRFIRRLRARRRSQGRELRYLYNIEHLHGEGRWHHHLFLNATGRDYEEVAELWECGGVEIHKIEIGKHKNYETLARYMCKEQRDKVGLRLWTGSRNLKKPECDCRRVPEDESLKPPKGATLLGEAGEKTQWGTYRWVKYLAPGWERGEKPRARRRRA